MTRPYTPTLTSPAAKPALVSRRGVLLSGATLAGFAAGTGFAAAPKGHTPPDLVAHTDEGYVEVTGLTERAFRVRVVKTPGLKTPESQVFVSQLARPKVRRSAKGSVSRVSLAHLTCEWDDAKKCLSFYDASGKTLLREAEGTRRLSPSQLGDAQVFVAEQGFVSPKDEYLFGTGCFQDGYLNLRGLPRRLTQVNTQISQPFMLSSKGYGLLWHNTGMSEVNPPSQRVELAKLSVEDAAKVANVTTTNGNAQVRRRTAVFEGRFQLAKAGPCAFLLDIGRKMASQHHVEIDGQVLADFSNLWLPPTTGFVAEMAQGEHRVRVLANDDEAPSLSFESVSDRTIWRSAVAGAIDYVVIAGPRPADVMSGYRELIGETPMMPRWAYGYLHCRERFHSSQEILDTAREFRARKLPVDVMVQDWQYWGKHGWNAMQFDESNYPDPAGLVRDLHTLDMRFMLSVWSKISKDTDLGKAFTAKGFYIPDTDWVDFFNPKAAAFYWENQSQRLASLGIDAWWQDATEPENDDLVGRVTAAGKGERVRLTYPVQVARTVYEGQRRDYPDRRVMNLTRSAFPGQQRYAAATWSGDIGNGWETLKRQIPAGLNMAAAGYPYWTVDAGGFFRPGDGQYTDPAYHERFLRWFQYATFLPMQRVHGYMTNTEFWRYGETVETVSRSYLELRYRLFPYIYSLAAQTNRHGVPLIRPLVFDFAADKTALEQSHSYMFGAAFHVAPVVSAGVTTWPVYLPQSKSAWVDAWTGEARNGGAWHDVEAPMERLPLHVRAGSIVPMGPVIQSTAEADGSLIDLFVFPGQDGAFELYEDDGLTYGYEKGQFSRIALQWDDGRSTLKLAAREGTLAKPNQSRRFRLHRVKAGAAPLEAVGGLDVTYTGAPMAVVLA